MAKFVNGFFEERRQALIELAGWVDNVFSAAGIEYCVAGGLATYYYVEEVEPDAGRLTKDIDIVVRREDLDKIREAVAPFGFRYRQVGGVAMLLRGSEPARRGIHLIFADPAVPELARGRPAHPRRSTHAACRSGPHEAHELSSQRRSSYH